MNNDSAAGLLYGREITAADLGHGQVRFSFDHGVLVITATPAGSLTREFIPATPAPISIPAGIKF